VFLIQIVISELTISMQTTVKCTGKCNFKLQVKKCVIPEHKDTSPLGGFFFLFELPSLPFQLQFLPIETHLPYGCQYFPESYDLFRFSQKNE